MTSKNKVWSYLGPLKVLSEAGGLILGGVVETSVLLKKIPFIPRALLVGAGVALAAVSLSPASALASIVVGSQVGLGVLCVGLCDRLAKSSGQQSLSNGSNNFGVSSRSESKNDYAVGCNASFKKAGATPFKQKEIDRLKAIANAGNSYNPTTV